MPEVGVPRWVVGNRPFADGDHVEAVAEFLQARGEVVAVDQHHIGGTDVTAIVRCEPEMVGVGPGGDQAPHIGGPAREGACEIAEHAVSCNHHRGRGCNRRGCHGDGQGRREAQESSEGPEHGVTTK